MIERYEEYLKYGFSGYLLKPISKDKLFEIIDKYLKQYLFSLNLMTFY